MEEAKYGEFRPPAPFNTSNGAKYRVGPPGYYTRTDDQTPFGGKRPNVVETINKYMEEAAKRQAEQDQWLKTFYQNTENNRIDHDKIIRKLESQVKTLTAEVETKATILEGCKAIFAKDGTPLLDFNNALADLGASISIIPFSMFKRLGIGKLKPISMVIEMADNTTCTPKGIIKNLLIKIDKFISQLIVILDIIEDFRMPIILGRPLLATAHAKIDIFTKTISLEVGNEKVIFKMKSNFSCSKHEYVQMIKTKMNTEEDKLIKIDSDLFTYNTNACEINHLLSIDPDVFTYDIEVHELYKKIGYRCSLIAQETNGELRSNFPYTKKKLHWCTPISRKKKGVQEILASCNPFGEKCDGGSLCHNEIKCYWESENDGNRMEVEWENLSLNDWLRIRECKENKILKTINNKLHDEWFKGTDEDDDDLEGIIDYLEPTLYDGFIDSDDEEYKEKKCTLLGTPYIKPPPIFIEKVNVTRYSIGPREVYRKLKILEVEELSRTRGNIATIRAEIMNEILKNDDKKESYNET
ncbi:RNA-directed DNA polymerase, eukaryota, reverse transcriptase zinc-binding domain protein [Tanacetum coccineum]